MNKKCSFTPSKMDKLRILSAKCGSIPKVQPIAAKTLCVLPYINPVDKVYSVPVPGIRTMINDVVKKVNDINFMPPFVKFIMPSQSCYL